MEKLVWIFSFLFFSLFGGIRVPYLLAQNTADNDVLTEPGGNADEKLAKAAQNPVANLISLPLQNNSNFGIGPDNETQNILNIQPVWPFEITDSFNLITRTILPVVSQPDILTGGEGRINGLGDTTFTGFFPPKTQNDSPGVLGLSSYCLLQLTISLVRINGEPVPLLCCSLCPANG